MRLEVNRLFGIRQLLFGSKSRSRQFLFVLGRRMFRIHLYIVLLDGVRVLRNFCILRSHIRTVYARVLMGFVLQGARNAYSLGRGEEGGAMRFYTSGVPRAEYGMLLCTGVCIFPHVRIL